MRRAAGRRSASLGRPLSIRHAHALAETLPLTVHEPPIALPEATEIVQWHRSRATDPGLKWLIGQLAAQAEKIAAGPSSVGRAVEMA